MTDFFENVWATHRGGGLYGAWATLGRGLGGAEKDLWNKMNKDALFLPFHATPEIWRSPAGRYMSCRRKSEQDPFTLLKNHLTDGRGVYCVYFAGVQNSENDIFHQEEPTPCHLNLSLNECEKRMRDFGPKPYGMSLRELGGRCAADGALV